ncbi:MAG: 50S ribosomal protein L5 [Bacteroidales bacterium]|nr:50S ribosomal protein L5 [Bacteroidales bacterium]
MPNFKQKYYEEIIPAMIKEFKYKNVMQVPKLLKIVINQGVGEGVTDKKAIETYANEIAAITGQKPIITKAKKDIANFKLRKGMPIGIKVTLRRNMMYEFLERLVCVAIPRIRDFRGLDFKTDGRGNYNLGIKEQIIFPEIDLDKIYKIKGLQITFVTNAKTDSETYSLLKHFGMPFKNIKK